MSYKSLQLQIKEETILLLREQKKKQRKTMSQIVEELIEEKYSSLQDRLKKLGE